MEKFKKSGLPLDVSMRHDQHFVDLISSRIRGPQLRLISIHRIDPNPHQARSELGNIQELMDSIKAKGILEPILVRPKGERFEIIAGERRYVASKNIGLTEIPCIELRVDDSEALELALIENLQRKDLEVFEEVDGLKALVDIYGYTHETIAERIGKSRSTITEILNLSRIPKKLREECQRAGITSRSTLIEISKMKDEKSMEHLIQEIKNRGLRREDTRELSKKILGKKSGWKRYFYVYKSKEGGYTVRIEFKKEKITKAEIIQILEEMIKKLKE